MLHRYYLLTEADQHISDNCTSAGWSDGTLSDRCQAITWTSNELMIIVNIMVYWTSGEKSSCIESKTTQYAYKKMYWNTVSVKQKLLSLGLDVLSTCVFPR